MNISATSGRLQSGATVAGARLDWKRAPLAARYRVEGVDVSATGDWALAALLLPAMREGGRLELDRPVSARLLASVDAIQGTFLSKADRFRRVELEAAAHGREYDAGERGVACFFSGGVDSFYSVLTHQEELTHLVFVHGFDIPLPERRLRAEVSAALRRAAAELGLRLIEVETDLRRVAEPHLRWAEEYYGAALISVAHLLAPLFRRVYIASGFGPEQEEIAGSTSHLDSLWSSEDTEIVHDRRVVRHEKMAFISHSPVALRTLRVCWENRGGAYNCGRCRKCLGVMVGLRLAGALERCETFPGPLDLEAVARIPLTNTYLDAFFRGYMEVAEQNGDKALAAALRRALERATPRQRAIDRMREQARASLRYRLSRLRRYPDLYRV